MTKDDVPPATLLDDKKILALLPSQFSQQVALEVFAALPSTNSYLQQLDESAISAAYQICLAEQQSAGRGRKAGRRWHSPFGENIYFSCRCRLHSQYDKLSLVVGLAVIRVIKRYSGDEAIGYKWPNDLLWRGKKIAGILVELMTRGDDCDAVIGLGLNVNMAAAAEEIDQPWASLRQITGRYINRNRLVAEIISELLTMIEAFQQLGFDYFRDEWQRYLVGTTN
ncbi:MAG: biotin--[acetyl-CoA-carboxylase] ligase [Gammaproteobacteria bacterium]|nr:biotin--[acetyl-CoA-carboxylase] ligase [Gammaproteobacteria bacterium]MCP4473916.1 biotin--[acetyl-CoA-carboxylase] ligase [Gammaproteobacteria bacterium]